MGCLNLTTVYLDITTVFLNTTKNYRNTILKFLFITSVFTCQSITTVSINKSVKTYF